MERNADLCAACGRGVGNDERSLREEGPIKSGRITSSSRDGLYTRPAGLRVVAACLRWARNIHTRELVGDAHLTSRLLRVLQLNGMGEAKGDVIIASIRYRNVQFPFGFFDPYLLLAFARLTTPLKSYAPLTSRYLTPGKSCARPPLTSTTECSCKLCPSPGI